MRDEQVKAGCSGKAGYLSWDKAHAAMSHLCLGGRHGRGEMNIYRCRFCGFWHIGRSS